MTIVPLDIRTGVVLLYGVMAVLLGTVLTAAHDVPLRGLILVVPGNLAVLAISVVGFLQLRKHDRFLKFPRFWWWLVPHGTYLVGLISGALPWIVTELGIPL